MTNKTGEGFDSWDRQVTHILAFQIFAMGILLANIWYNYVQQSMVVSLLIGSPVIILAIAVSRNHEKVQSIMEEVIRYLEVIFGSKASTASRRIGILTLLGGIGFQSWPVVTGAFLILWYSRGEAIKEERREIE